jgi:hypothetical protein
VVESAIATAPDVRGALAMPWHGHAFGLALEATFAIPCAPAPSTPHPDRQVALVEAPDRELRSELRRARATPLVERRLADGSLGMIVERYDGLGYRVWAPRHGHHVVSDDGSLIRSAIPRVAPWRWQRLLFAQVLPLAAALQGLEIFHASAVVLDGRAFAFFAPSGVGKSSLAAHLVAAGADLLTDDVLAIEPSPRRLWVYSGAGITGLAGAELRAMTRAGRTQLGRELGRDDKVYLAPSVRARRLRLGGVYFLTRNREIPELAIEQASTAPLRALLGSGFLPYLDSSAYLTRHLDVCVQIAESVPIFELAVPSDVPARELASVVASHANALLEGQENE